MNCVDFSGISLYQMEICVTVARFKSITKAAEALNTSQPGLSKKITQIEEQLGLVLFVRGKNTSLRATPAGLYLCSEWEKILREFRTSFNRAFELQECKTECLTIATTPSAQTSLFIWPLVAEFRAVNPNIELRVDSCSITEAKKRLCAGTLDIALVSPYLKEIFEVDELKSQMVAQCPLSVGMLKKNPLVKYEAIRVEDLRSQHFVLPQSSAFIKYVTEICESHGFAPTISYYAKYFHGISMCLATNDEVFLTDRFFQAYYDESCAYFDLPDTKSGIIMVLRKYETNKYVESFAASAIKQLSNLLLPNKVKKC